MIVEFNKYQKPEVRYYSNGQKRAEVYFLDGKKHRIDGPAVQYWYDNGQKRTEVYYLEGTRHREDGLAFQSWYDNGQKRIELYYLDGNFHREDGTAFQSWYKNGQKETEYYHLNGKEYSRSEWLEKLKEIGSIHYDEQKILYDAEQYNI